MSTLRFLYCRSSRIYTPFLRWVMWSSWCHQAVVLADEADTVIDATLNHGGVRRRALSTVIADSSVYAFRDIDCPDPIAAHAFLRAQLGKPYDLAAAVGIGLHRDWKREDAWFCSELAEAALAAGGNVRFINSPRRVTPQLSWMVR